MSMLGFKMIYTDFNGCLSSQGILNSPHGCHHLPVLLDASSTVTLHPSPCSLCAAARPATPAPMTMTSACSASTGDWMQQLRTTASTTCRHQGVKHPVVCMLIAVSCKSVGITAEQHTGLANVAQYRRTDLLLRWLMHSTGIQR